MSEYPKHFVKGESRKTANNPRQAVELSFKGYRETEAPVAPADDNAPMLPLAELVEKAEAAGVDVDAAVQSWETNGGATEPAKTKSK